MYLTTGRPKFFANITLTANQVADRKRNGIVARLYGAYSGTNSALVNSFFIGSRGKEVYVHDLTRHPSFRI
jgi:hypothetical protein